MVHGVNWCIDLHMLLWICVFLFILYLFDYFSILMPFLIMGGIIMPAF